MECYELIFEFFKGIVNWGQVARAYGENFKEHGGSIHLGFTVKSIEVNDTSKAVKIQGAHRDQVLLTNFFFFVKSN